MPSLRRIIERITVLPPLGMAEGLDSWRTRVLDSLIKVMLPLGLIPMIPALAAGVREREWWTVWVDAVVYPVLALVAFHPKVSSRVRALGLVVAIQALGFALVLASNRIGGAVVWLVLAPLLATVLFDRAGLWASNAANLVAVIAIAVWASYAGPSLTPGKMSLANWVATGTNLVFVCFASSIIIGGVVAGLRAATEGSRDAYTALRDGHAQLSAAHERLESETRALKAAEAERKAQTEMRERLETQLRQSQKMEAIGRLAGGIAHDFNNMLTAILGFSDLTRERLRHDDQACADIDEIRAAAERAQIMTRQLLALSQRQITQPKAISLSSYVKDMQPVLAQLVGAGIELDLDVAEDAGLVLMDPGQLDQVVLNLVVNSRDAMPEGGRLTIMTTTETAEGEPAGPSGDGNASPGPHAVLIVRDDGTGMTTDVHERMFEPFFTTKPHGSGTGLGLATVHGIVTQHGGFIQVETAPGSGTEMRVCLPLTDAPTSAENQEPPQAPPLGTGTLLLVEDEANVRRLALRVLEKAGYRVFEAASPAEALALLQEQDIALDLLVTDVVLPGMNGKQLYDRLIRDRAGLRVLYMSGYAEDAIARQGSLPPGTDFLEKPFHPSTLTERVAAALARSSSTA